MEVAVIIPCYNESMTIGKVVRDFREQLPDAQIYVYDNNSADDTSAIAAEAGAIVRKERQQGKGNVVRTMFRDVDADIYIMIDGDDTYPAEEVHKLMEPIQKGEADMVIGDRLTNGTYESENTRLFHGFGNQLVRGLINYFFNGDLKDIMTGYRVFNKKFVKNIPVLCTGFEIETSMTLHALHKRFHIQEIPIQYRDRPEGSFSKLNTFSDGIRVLSTILQLFKDYKPFAFFSMIALALFIAGVGIGTPVIYDYIQTGLVPKFPSAILATGLMILSVISFTSGLILDTIVKHQRESFELWLNRYRD